VGAERLREVVGGERHAPLGQIEAERVAHGPAEPRIGAHLRWPHALDQAADHDAVDALQPRFERTVDAHTRPPQLPLSHRAVRNRRAEHVGIVRRRHREIGVGRAPRDLLECGIERHAVGAEEGCRRAGLVRAQRGDDAPVPLRELGEGCGAQPVERRERRAQPRHEGIGGVEVRGAEAGARIGRMQIGRFTPPQFCELGAERGERVREPADARPRPRAAQDGLFERRDRARVSAFGDAEPRERVLEEGEQRNRRKPAERGVRRQPREPSRGRVRERVAAGIVDRDFPALQRRQHPTRQGAVGRDQGRGLVRRLERLAQANRDGERFLLGVGGLDHRPGFERALDRQRDIASGELLPALGGGGGPQRLGDIALAVMRTRSAQRGDLLARNADAAQQRLHGELRMLDRRRNPRVAIAAAADQLPGLRVEREVEAGQHHGAAVKLGDGGDQLGGCRHGAGRAGGDHRSVRVRGKPRGFGLDQRVAAR